MASSLPRVDHTGFLIMGTIEFCCLQDPTRIHGCSHIRIIEEYRNVTPQVIENDSEHYVINPFISLRY